MTTIQRLTEADMATLFDALKADGRTVVGPRVEDDAIVYGELGSVDELPQGIGAQQAPGSYRLERGRSPLWFGFAAPARPLKHWFHPEREELYSIRRSQHGFAVQAASEPPRRLAVFGARACDLEGLRRLDEVLLGGKYPDARYAARRADTLLVAANCTTVAATCFCTSMGTGPRATRFDLALTEVVIEAQHLFLLEVGSDAGAQVVSGLAFPSASSAELARATEAVDAAARSMQRHVDPETARHTLGRSLEHPHWEAVAQRCLACTNCTASCPTCFCTSIEDGSSLDGTRATRTRTSDSCFNSEFSHIHGGSVRNSVAARYRQWLTHKFSTWHDQFGTSGCVGCGRCITWCPVGIDVTQELAHFEHTEVNGEVEQ